MGRVRGPGLRAARPKVSVKPAPMHLDEARARLERFVARWDPEYTGGPGLYREVQAVLAALADTFTAAEIEAAYVRWGKVTGNPFPLLGERLSLAELLAALRLRGSGDLDMSGRDVPQ
jgi:hypothetical protein